MEKTITERYATDADKRRWDFPVFKSTPSVYDNSTDNTVHPRVAVNGMRRDAYYFVRFVVENRVWPIASAAAFPF